MKAPWLALAVALGLLCPSVQAQQNVEIIDVLPAVDPGIAPDLAFVSCDFLIGAQVRPSWWGQSFRDNGLSGRQISAQLEVGESPKATKLLPLAAHISEPQWNEALGHYILHARFHRNGEKWPKGKHFYIKGELSPPFTNQVSAQQLTFLLSFDPPRKRGYPRAALVSPRPQLWVRSIRIGVNEAFGVQKAKPSFPYEASITVAGPRVTKREETRSLPEFVGEDGVRLPPTGARGLFGGLGHDEDTTNLLLANSEIEFVTYRVGFDSETLETAPSIWVGQRLELAGRKPLKLNFPLKRDGKLLIGEVPPQEWKVSQLQNQ